MKEKAKHLPSVSERGGKQHWRRHDEFFNESLLAHLHTHNTQSHACKLALQAQTMAIKTYIVISLAHKHMEHCREWLNYIHTLNTHRFLLKCCEVGAHWVDWGVKQVTYLLTCQGSVLVTIQVASGHSSGKEMQAIATTGATTPTFDMKKCNFWW